VTVLHVALLEPEIPPNTGNIARLCAATGTRLHLLGKLGFKLDDKNLKRAGLDYWPSVDLALHDSFDEFERTLESPRLWLIETPATQNYTQCEYRDGDAFLFGCESKGLPQSLRERYADRMIGIPMPTGAVRSLNLATAVGIVVYEALRQVRCW